MIGQPVQLTQGLHLQKVARIGPQHQAGSDSLLTCTTFFKMRQMFFEDKIDDQKYL
jgi:CCR4-NOT transcription complex subunit 7/8